MRTFIVSEEVDVILDGDLYKLEKGDVITFAALEEGIVSEAAVKRCYLHVTDGDREYYVTAPSANDNYLIRFLARLCRDNYDYDAEVVESVPPGGKRRSAETFLRSLP